MSAIRTRSPDISLISFGRINGLSKMEADFLSEMPSSSITPLTERSPEADVSVVTIVSSVFSD